MLHWLHWRTGPNARVLQATTCLGPATTPTPPPIPRLATSRGPSTWLPTGAMALVRYPLRSKKPSAPAYWHESTSWAFTTRSRCAARTPPLRWVTTRSSLWPGPKRSTGATPGRLQTRSRMARTSSRTVARLPATTPVIHWRRTSPLSLAAAFPGWVTAEQSRPRSPAWMMALLMARSGKDLPTTLAAPQRVTALILPSVLLASITAMPTATKTPTRALSTSPSGAWLLSGRSPRTPAHGPT